MTEIELKLRIPATGLAALDAELVTRGAGRRIGLEAVYFDTPGRALAAAKLALRIRREGRARVQTLKGAGPDGLTRLEHDAPAPRDGRPDPARHAGTPVGERLLAALGSDGGALAPRFSTDILRRRLDEPVPHGRVEWALDVGRIVAGGHSLRVCELEIELLEGSPRAVLEAARGIVRAHGAWIDLRSKAAAGERLARGLACDPVARGTPVEQLLGNAAEIADGTATAAHREAFDAAARTLGIAPDAARLREPAFNLLALDLLAQAAAA